MRARFLCVERKRTLCRFFSFFCCCSRKKHKTRFFIVKVGCGVAIVFVVVSALRLAPLSRGRKKWSHHHRHHQDDIIVRRRYNNNNNNVERRRKMERFLIRKFPTTSARESSHGTNAAKNDDNAAKKKSSVDTREEGPPPPPLCGCVQQRADDDDDDDDDAKQNGLVEGVKWQAKHASLLVRIDHSCPNKRSSKIACFDLDETLQKTKSGRKPYADDERFYVSRRFGEGCFERAARKWV